MARVHFPPKLSLKVYEVDPFLCLECGGEMRVVAVIQVPDELRKIIEWAQAHQERGPPVVSA